MKYVQRKFCYGSAVMVSDTFEISGCKPEYSVACRVVATV